jgi:polysaccharide export outer membrane protein
MNRNTLRAASRRSSIGRFGFAALAFTALTALTTLNACVEQRPYVWVNDLPKGTVEPAGAIEARDTLLVIVKNQTALSGEFVVRDDGGYLQPTLGNIPVAGKTPEVVAAELAARLKDIIVLPEVTVALVKVAAIRVNVVGEVKTPGAYDLTRDRGVITALAAAGWLTDFAHRDRIFVVRSGDQRIRFQAAALTGAEVHASRFKLHDGDVVVVE